MTYNLSVLDATQTGTDNLITQVATGVSSFTPMLLLFIWAIITITGYKKQKESGGFGDAPLWTTIGGIVTTVVALILSRGTNMITLTILVSTVVLTILSGIWLMSSGDRQ